METESLVSIIVPIYNVEKYLSCCLDRIIGQTYDNIEVLLIDDGSTDQSGVIADVYAQKDSRIQVFHTENRGVSHARNIGLDNMSGKYCLLVDSDDALHKDVITRSVKLLEQEKLDCVIYRYQTVEDRDFEDFIQTIEQQNTLDKYIWYSHDELMREILIGQRFRMLACNKLYKASLWENVRFPVGRKYGDDTSVSFRLADKCLRGGYIETSLYFYRMRKGSALHSKVSMDNLQLFLSYSELLKYYQKHVSWLMDEAYFAYVVRMFDFFAIIKRSALTDNERNNLLKGLRKISSPYYWKLCFSNKATCKQRLLLCIFFLSVNVFWKLMELF